MIDVFIQKVKAASICFLEFDLFLFSCLFSCEYMGTTSKSPFGDYFVTRVYSNIFLAFC